MRVELRIIVALDAALMAMHGRADARRGRETINAYTLAFLDQYLREGNPAS